MDQRHKKSQTAFTLIELIVVVLIVAILAAVVVPIFRGKITAAKWSEGRAIAGTIASALRAYSAEKNGSGTYGNDLPNITDMGFDAGDFSGTYFDAANYTWQTSYNASNNPILSFTIIVTAPSNLAPPTLVTIDQTGNWTEIP